MPRFVDRWLHESLTNTIDARRQAGMLFVLTVGLVTGGLIVTVEHYVLGNERLARDFGGLVVLGLLTVIAFRYVSSSRLLANLVPLQTFAGATVINLHIGGVGFPSFFALVLAPQSAFLLAGPRSGIFFTFLAFAEMVLLWSAHPAPETISQTPGWPVMQLTGGGALLVIISGLTWAYERLKNDTVAELERERMRADEATRAQGEFLANVSHEIRTPMNGVLGSLQLLETQIGGEQQSTVRVATQSARALLRLLDDVLAMARLEEGEVPIRHAPADVGVLVSQVAQWFSAQAEGKGLTLECTVPDEPVPALVDAPRLQQVLSNLVGNAVKFTDAGSIFVRLRQVNGELRFEVEDTGCGIPPDQLTRVFERFHQADGSLSRRHGGTGLGLTISHELVARMGGEITVDSEVDKGTCFSFQLCPERVDALPMAPPTITRHVALDRPVLLVEDDTVNRLVVTRLLELIGVVCDVATDGAEAVRAVADNAYCMVLMDCQMPGMDGFEATRRIRALPGPASRVPIVALTAQALDGDREACLEAGMNDYATKPITKEALLRVVTAWAGRGPG